MQNNIIARKKVQKKQSQIYFFCSIPTANTLFQNFCKSGIERAT